MNLQIALDRLTREECIKVLRETEQFADWIEIGTGVIKEYGMSIVREIKQAYPHKTVIADMKTCDAGKHEAAQAFEAGADITTVMAFSANKTITDTLMVAEEHGKQIMVDLLGITERSRVAELQALGVDLVSLHFGKDMQSEGQMGTDLFSLTQGYSGLKVAVAGGINIDTLPGVKEKRPYTVIVGSAITGSDNPYEAARAMKGLINQ
ncbi:3-hexulose-6-phosphate synthase [Cytobacillus sp. NCCP-133]|uniref:3-hexulose-6-phosphate synthase n=1 Tax=Cytobacillus sp. NCCP-133 TaxID=766848 RepID=UPI0022319B08|nr:3-hexulose-6-phosphate synthase [Cytobacillus sp. NCCP-133]GLB61073.1 3-hexulose-6-phosphate synthase [Cytobacillus sp. NCCP-133]